MLASATPTCYRQCQGIVSSYKRGLCHTWKMTFPAVWVTSSQGLVLGLALRAASAAVLDKNLCCNWSAAPRAWWCAWMTFPGLWATSDGHVLQAILVLLGHGTFQVLSGFCMCWKLNGDCGSKPWEVMCLDTCKILFVGWKNILKIK